jgi:hypothetical protein
MQQKMLKSREEEIFSYIVCRPKHEGQYLLFVLKQQSYNTSSLYNITVWNGIHVIFVIVIVWKH